MADEYDPTDCELGICGPCDACLEQEARDQQQDFIELGDEIPEVRNVSGENPNSIGYDTAGQTAIANGGRKEEAGTIDLTPSWVSVVSIYLEVIADPDSRDQVQKDARAEILRAAQLADLYVKEHKR